MGVVLPSGERPDALSLESGRAEAALIQQIPLLAGTSEEVYFLGARAGALPQSFLLCLTQTQLFHELAPKHRFRCCRLERWRWLGWMMPDA